MSAKIGFNREEAKSLEPLYVAHTAWVYSIVCKANGKRYIGCTRILKRRLFAHLATMEKGKHPIGDLQKDFDKFGAEQFEVELLQITSDGLERGAHEKEWQIKFESYNREKGYNYKDPHFYACKGGNRWEKRDRKNKS